MQKTQQLLDKIDRGMIKALTGEDPADVLGNDWENTAEALLDDEEDDECDECHKFLSYDYDPVSRQSVAVCEDCGATYHRY